MSSTEKRVQIDEKDEDIADSKYNSENKQTTLPARVVEELQLTEGDRIVYARKKLTGEITIRRWARKQEEAEKK